MENVYEGRNGKGMKLIKYEKWKRRQSDTVRPGDRGREVRKLNIEAWRR